jgi:CRP-like cAMP-binding protein
VQVKDNRLLAALPPQERGRLLPKLEVVSLEKGRTLHQIGDVLRYVYFPIAGFCSLVALTSDGAMLEIASVGNEGMIGVPVILKASIATCLALVQASGTAYRLRSDILADEIQRDSVLQTHFLQYTYRRLTEMSQAIVCHHFHSALQRVCRWLLMAAERLQSDTLDVTHEVIAHALGMPRTGVTETAVRLQDARAITCRHGRITILQRTYLAAAACECNRIVGDADEDTQQVRVAITLTRAAGRARTVG